MEIIGDSTNKVQGLKQEQEKTQCDGEMETEGNEDKNASEHAGDAINFRSSPDVVHVVKSKPNIPLMFNLHGQFYVPLTRQNLFHPHWLQDMLDKDLRFSLNPITDEVELPQECDEGRRILQGIKYITANLSWNPRSPINLQLQLAECYRNTRLGPRRQRIKPLLAKSLYVDHETKSVVFQGKNFNFAVGVPFQCDIEDNNDDPGANIDLGLYVKELDGFPGVKLRWYVAMQLSDLPDSAKQLALSPHALSVMDID